MPKVISFHYTLTVPTGQPRTLNIQNERDSPYHQESKGEGQTVDSSIGQEPLSFVEGSRQIIPGLEASLLQLKLSDKKKISVPAAEAYGPRDERFVLNVPREKLPVKDIEVGQQFQVGEDPSVPPFTVVSTTATEVVLDGNHPLAGVDLTFDVEIMNIREATAEELAHGHIHGPGGHEH